MRKEIHIEVDNLEENDTVCGYRIKELVFAAQAAKKAGVTNEDLAQFLRNAQNAYAYVKQDFEEAINKTFER